MTITIAILLWKSKEKSRWENYVQRFFIEKRKNLYIFNLIQHILYDQSKSIAHRARNKFTETSEL